MPTIESTGARRAKETAQMTRTANARIAGFTYLLYIALGIPAFVLLDRATNAREIAAKFAGIAQHEADVRIAIVLTLLTCFAALVLGVTLYAITREQDPDLAMLALSCRVAEGVFNAAVGLVAMLGVLWLGTSAQPGAPDAAAGYALGGFLLKVLGWNPIISATFFAVGSTLFSWLLLRGRMIPAPLAWLGVVASVLLVVVLPLQLAGILGGAITQSLWLPMLVFEVSLALWLLIKGVR
jgi:hypothetical protein